MSWCLKVIRTPLKKTKKINDYFYFQEILLKMLKVEEFRTFSRHLLKRVNKHLKYFYFWSQNYFECWLPELNENILIKALQDIVADLLLISIESILLWENVLKNLW